MLQLEKLDCSNQDVAKMETKPDNAQMTEDRGDTPVTEQRKALPAEEYMVQHDKSDYEKGRKQE